MLHSVLFRRGLTNDRVIIISSDQLPLFTPLPSSIALKENPTKSIEALNTKALNFN